MFKMFFNLTFQCHRSTYVRCTDSHGTVYYERSRLARDICPGKGFGSEYVEDQSKRKDNRRRDSETSLDHAGKIDLL